MLVSLTGFSGGVGTAMYSIRNDFGRARTIAVPVLLGCGEVNSAEAVMLTTSALAGTAALVGDPARASMLMALMDGRALTASELARVAGIMPQTASGHLAQLVTAGLLSYQRQGR